MTDPAPPAIRHGYTPHGHPCCDQPPTGPRPGLVARCGGPGPCRECGVSAAGIHRAAPSPHACTCVGGPTTIARIVDQELVTVEHRHHPLACGLPSTWTTPADYQADARDRAPRGGRR